MLSPKQSQPPLNNLIQRESSTHQPHKLLFVGPTKESNLPTLFSKITGELDAVILLGITEPQGGDLPTPPCELYVLEIQSIKANKKIIPPKFHFLSGVGELEINSFHFVYSTIDEAVDNANYEDILAIASHYYRVKSCDFFISSYWPSHILYELENSKKPSFNVNYSYVAAIIARAIQPRYHICIGKEYYQRPLYSNNTVAESPQIHPTTFISLAPEIKESKQKSVTFITTSSVTEGVVKDRSVETHNNPYNQIQFTREKFYEFKHATSTIATTQQQVQQKPKPLVRISFCWFCLANPKNEAHLIISCGQYNYLCYPKGPLVDYHIQIIPIDHLMSYHKMEPEGVTELGQYIQSINNFYNSVNTEAVVFESVSFSSEGEQSHTFMQSFPVELNSFERLFKHITTFLADFNRSLQLIKLQSQYDLSQIPNGLYLFICFANSTSYYVPLFERLQPSTVREIMATWYGLLDRINWKRCKEEYTVEERKSRELRHQFHKFDAVL